MFVKTADQMKKNRDYENNLFDQKIQKEYDLLTDLITDVQDMFPDLD
jgi:hypothetical protein